MIQDRYKCTLTYLETSYGELSDGLDDTCVLRDLDEFAQLVVGLETCQQTAKFVIVTRFAQALDIQAV